MAGLATRPALTEGGLDLRRARHHLIGWKLGFDRVVGWLLAGLFVVAILPIADLVYWVGAKALPTLTWATLTTNPVQPFTPHGSAGGLWAPILGTFLIVLIATAVAIALGLFGGIAAAEFMSPRWASWARIAANTLVGMPAIIIGVFGLFLFCTYFGWGLVLIAGAIATAIFMTPYIFRAADLAFTSVPRHIREAAYGSGARPIDYVLRVARPIVTPPILNGVFLAIALGIGETATVVVTVAASNYPANSLFGPTSFLTYMIYYGTGSAYSTQVTQAYQAAFLLLVAVIALNVIIRFISWRSSRRLEGLFT